MKKSVNIEDKLIPIGFFIFLIMMWQIAVDAGFIERFTLPAPKDIIVTLIEILPDALEHVSVTLQEAFAGFIISVALAIILAVLMDNILVVKKGLYPLILVSQTVPLIALAPLFAMWFGFGKLPKIIVVVLVCFFPILVSLLHGLESIDKDLINLLKSMGASKLHIFKIVKFPASLVSFFSGLKIAATYSIMGAVIGEWMGGEAGLGIYMMRIKHSYAYDKFFAVILIIVLLSLALFRIISLIQDLLMPWSTEMNEKNRR
jgi:ABC-type nitrate/sulfonate/bicarbonate transport system permease component